MDVFAVLLAGWLALAQPALPFVEIDPQSTIALRQRGSQHPFVAVGVNYFSPDTGWAPQLWARFDVDKVRRELTLVREQGYNAIRVFLTLDGFHREPGVLHPDGMVKFRTLLEICRSLGLYVIPSGPDHWEGTPAWRAGKDRFADEDMLRADAQWWEVFAGTFRDEPAILAYDLFNEPTVHWDTPAMRIRWQAWLRSEYGVPDALGRAWNLPAAELTAFDRIDIPPAQPSRHDARLHDYQRFRDSIGSAWTRRMVGAIRSADPNHLVTIGHIQWASPIHLPSIAHYAGFDLRDNARHVDFVTVHFYPLAPPNPTEGPRGRAHNLAYLAALLHECDAGKPIMLGEFAWYGGGAIRQGDTIVLGPQSVEDQLAWGRDLLELTAGRLCGWLHWGLADTPSSNDLTRYSGLFTEDFRIKPWGEAYRIFARRTIASPPLHRPWPDALRDMPVDRRTLLTDPSAGLSHLEAVASRLAATRPADAPSSHE